MVGGKEDWIGSDDEPLTGLKIGGESLITRSLEEINKEIDDLYISFVKHNDSKNIFALSNQLIYQPVYEKFIQHAIRAMLNYAAIQDGSV